MPVLRCYVAPDILEALERHARERGRTAEDLAECAIAEAVLAAGRHERPAAPPAPGGAEISTDCGASWRPMHAGERPARGDRIRAGGLASASARERCTRCDGFGRLSPGAVACAACDGSGFRAVSGEGAP